MAVSLHFSPLVSSGFSISRLSSQVTCKTFYLTVFELLQPRLLAINSTKLTFSLIAHLPFAVIRLKMRQVSQTQASLHPAPRPTCSLRSMCVCHFPTLASLTGQQPACRLTKISGKRWQVAFKCRTFI